MSDTIVDNYKINLKTQTARIEFLNSRNTYGDKDFQMLLAIERWLMSKGVFEIVFCLSSHEYAGKIFLSKANYVVDKTCFKKDLKHSTNNNNCKYPF